MVNPNGRDAPLEERDVIDLRWILLDLRWSRREDCWCINTGEYIHIVCMASLSNRETRGDAQGTKPGEVAIMVFFGKIIDVR